MLAWSRVEGVQVSPLDVVVGQWCDAGGMMYDVSKDEQGGRDLHSCTVKFWKNSYMESSPGLIRLAEDGQLAWGHTHMFDAGSSSHSFWRWISLCSGLDFVWYRVHGAAPSSGHRNTEHHSTDHDPSKGSKREPPNIDFSPHFCIFENDPRGICCWSLGAVPQHWDEILLSLLNCMMMDGEWSSAVHASAYVGAEAIHVNGEVQNLMLLPGGDSPQSNSVSPSLWEELVWKYYGENAPGLRWELMGRDSQVANTKEMQLMRVDALLDAAPVNSVALVFDNGPADVTFENLKLQGMYRAPIAQKVFCLLGSSDSTTVDRFKDRLGERSVLHVSLTSEKSCCIGMPMAKIACFLSGEFSRGTLAYAIAGLEYHRDLEKPVEPQVPTKAVSIVADFEEKFFFLTGTPNNLHL